MRYKIICEGCGIDMLRGNNVLLVTPFLENYEVDEKSLINLVDYVLEKGVDIITVFGTTGEFFSLKNHEKRRIIDLVSERVKGKCPFIAGAANSGTQMSVELAKYAGSKGAEAVLLTPPYYMNPSDEGMIEHFTRVANDGGVDLMLYDGGGGIEIPIQVLKEVKKNSPNLKYVKLTTPKPDKVSKIHDTFNKEIAVFAGEDHLIMPELYAGAVGLTTAAGNFRPAELSKIYRLVQNKEYEEAQRIHDMYIAPQAIVTGSIRNEFIQCFKIGLKLMGIIEHDIVRPPLHKLSNVRIENLKRMLKNQKLI